MNKSTQAVLIENNAALCVIMLNFVEKFCRFLC